VSTVQANFSTIHTLSDLLRGLGDVPLDRIRFQPRPGTATVQDVIDLQEQQGLLYELIEGVLLEKAVGYIESRLAGYLLFLFNAFVIPRNLGIVTGADGTVELLPDLIRIPDVAFIRWDRLPGQRSPTTPIPRLAPNLVIEVLSRSNTPGEMAAKRRDYFLGGVEIVWEIDPDARICMVYTSPLQSTQLGLSDTLDGGGVLPGFALPLQELFGELDRQG
jgi:Uma2 family endonuclease